MHLYPLPFPMQFHMNFLEWTFYAFKTNQTKCPHTTPHMRLQYTWKHQKLDQNNSVF